VEIAPLEEMGKIVYNARNNGMTAQELRCRTDPDNFTVKMLYSSVWALNFGSKAQLFVGLGITMDGSKVFLMSPSNSSCVTIPRAWTQDIRHEGAADDAASTGLLVRALGRAAHRSGYRVRRTGNS
jgi:hypothetical protein